MWSLMLRLSLTLIKLLTRPKVVDRLAAGADKTGRKPDDHLVELLRLGSALFHPYSKPQTGPVSGPDREEPHGTLG